LALVFRSVDDPGLSFDLEALDRFREIGHSFLGERSPDDVPSQVFHRGFFPGMDAGAAENLKTGMPPGFQQINMIGSDLTFREKQGKDFRSISFSIPMN